MNDPHRVADPGTRTRSPFRPVFRPGIDPVAGPLADPMQYPATDGPRARPAPAVIQAAAALLTALALGWTLWEGLRQPSVALAFALLIVLGEAVRVTLPGDRESAPLGSAAALGYALLGEVDGRAVEHGVLQVIAVTGVACLVGLAPQVALGRAPAPDRVARRVLTVALLASGLRLLHAGPVSGLVALEPEPGPSLALRLLPLLVLPALLAVGAGCDAALAAAFSAARTGRPYRLLLREELRGLLGIGSAVCATGAVMAPAVAAAGLWALPLLSAPLLLTQLSFRRHAAVRATYRQTIASLARTTEMAGYTPPGHAQRVTRLSRAVGRELGLAESELTVLEYAALMHDVGQLSLVDPVTGGATELLEPAQRRRIARLGGAVVRQTGVSPKVAVVVERQADPYREQPRTASILRAANALADLAPDGGADAVQSALRRLAAATENDYEPRVVSALSRVVARGRVL